MVAEALPEAGAIRNALDVQCLTEYFRQTLPWMALPVTVKQFSNGQSNPTYLVQNAKSQRYVLRKKPPGQLGSSKAHAVEREYAILKAIKLYNSTLADSAQRIPVPNVFCLCTDVSIIGSSFYIMEFLDGRIMTDAHLPFVSVHERAHYWLELVRVQGLLARLSPAKLDLPPSVLPTTPYYRRLTPSLAKLARHQAPVRDMVTGQSVGLMPGFEKLAHRFQTTIPEDLLKISMTHGDLKMDNVVFHPKKCLIIGILDWELCTSGSPLCDFAGGISPYFIPAMGLPGSMPGVLGFQGSLPDGLPCLETLVKVWCTVSGTSYPLKDLYWAMAWQFWRGSIIAQGIAARYATRQASSANAETYGKRRFVYTDLAEKYLNLYLAPHAQL